ncbi:hypothetical protein ACFLQN_03950 [Candidatus Aenigmatarchaeota archaeon]
MSTLGKTFLGVFRTEEARPVTYDHGKRYAVTGNTSSLEFGNVYTFRITGDGEATRVVPESERRQDVPVRDPVPWGRL